MCLADCSYVFPNGSKLNYSRNGLNITLIMHYYNYIIFKEKLIVQASIQHNKLKEHPVRKCSEKKNQVLLLEQGKKTASSCPSTAHNYTKLLINQACSGQDG